MNISSITKFAIFKKVNLLTGDRESLAKKSVRKD